MTRIEQAGDEPAHAGCSPRASQHRSARTMTRRLGCIVIAVAFLSGCAGAPPPPSAQRGIRRCDRNGDLEERLACDD